MADKRLVHDILFESRTDGQKRRPVAFIQHGNREDGNLYEAICPWCGHTLAFLPEKSTRVVGGLYRVLLYTQKLHWPTCEKQPREMDLDAREQLAVEITTKPLNVEKLPTVQIGGDDERKGQVH